jgi:mono/diheme cytochrome c family protein
MTERDLRAIAVYLKDLPSPAATTTPVAADDPAMKAGMTVYRDNCAACHVGNGTGVAHLFPTLKGSATVQSSDPTSLIRVVLEGARSVATDPAPTGPAMPAFGWKLSDADTAAVLTYIRNSWGNAAPAVSADDVKTLRDALTSEARAR